MRYIIGILVLGVVVLFHEFGHFLLARKNGVVVEEFTFGFGPRIWSHKSKKSGTTYAWRLLPFGGSCAMLNEDEGEAIPGSFVGAAIWRRALIVAAGPVFNFILAFLVSLVTVGVGGADPAYVAAVDAGSPEEEAGLLAGDRIVRYDGHHVGNARDLYFDELMSPVPTDVVRLRVVRGGKTYNISFAPETRERYLLGFRFQDAPKEDGPGVQMTMLTKGSAIRKAGAQMGDVLTAINGQKVNSAADLQDYLAAHPLDGSPVSLQLTRDHGKKQVTLTDISPDHRTEAVLHFDYSAARERVGVIGTIQYAFEEVGYWLRVTVRSLAGMFNGTFTVNDMSGPVGIVKNIGDTYGEAAHTVSAAAGVLTLLSMMAMLSANLGLMNLLPLPALDGGRLLLMLVEAIRRKPVNRSVESNINFYGFLVLLAFMLYVTVHDILRLF